MDSSRKPLLVVDLVGTLEDNWRDKRRWLLNRGYEFPPWQPPRNDIIERVGEETYLEMKMAVATAETIPMDPPITGSVEALRSLRPHFQIAILSTRAAHLREPTERFLLRRFNGLYDSLHLLGDERGRAREKKMDWCVSRGAHAFVDDDHRHLHGMSGWGLIPFLLNLGGRPVETPRGAILASSWDEITRILLGTSDAPQG